MGISLCIANWDHPPAIMNLLPVRDYVGSNCSPGTVGTRFRPAVGALIVLGFVSYQSDRGGVSFCGILKKKENDLFIERNTH